MRTIKASEFKATCLKLMDEVAACGRAGGDHQERQARGATRPGRRRAQEHLGPAQRSDRDSWRHHRADRRRVGGEPLILARHPLPDLDGSGGQAHGSVGAWPGRCGDRGERSWRSRWSRSGRSRCSWRRGRLRAAANRWPAGATSCSSAASSSCRLAEQPASPPHNCRIFMPTRRIASLSPPHRRSVRPSSRQTGASSTWTGPLERHDARL